MFTGRVTQCEEFREQQRIYLAIAHAAEQEGIQFSRYGGFLEMDADSTSSHPQESPSKEKAATPEPVRAVE
jgi:hypothetical protein